MAAWLWFIWIRIWKISFSWLSLLLTWTIFVISCISITPLPSTSYILNAHFSFSSGVPLEVTSIASKNSWKYKKSTQISWKIYNHSMVELRLLSIISFRFSLVWIFKYRFGLQADAPLERICSKNRNYKKHKSQSIEGLQRAEEWTLYTSLPPRLQPFRKKTKIRHFNHSFRVLKCCH